MKDQPVVLMVDDDPAFMNRWVNELYLAGFKVVLAETLEEGRRAILTEPRLDLAVLDMMIRVARAGSPFVPEDSEQTRGGALSGVFLACFILENRPDLPFIGLSVSADDETRKWFEENGAGFITKYEATRFDDFSSVISKHMRKSVLNTTGAQPMPVKKPTDSVRADQLQLQLTRLEREYELAKMGLGKSQAATGMGVVSVLVTMLLAFSASMWGARNFLSGTNIVVIVAIVAVALVAYAAMIFGRAARLKARMTATEKELEMVLGDDVRS
jgi:CheY-like chemotaxis protein